MNAEHTYVIQLVLYVYITVHVFQMSTSIYFPWSTPNTIQILHNLSAMISLLFLTYWYNPLKPHTCPQLLIAFVYRRTTKRSFTLFCLTVTQRILTWQIQLHDKSPFLPQKILDWISDLFFSEHFLQLLQQLLSQITYRKKENPALWHPQ